MRTITFVGVAAAFTAFAVLATPSSLDAQGWQNSHASQDLRSWIATRFAGEQKISAQSTLTAARAAGLVMSTADRHLWKRQLRELSKARGGSGRFLSFAPTVDKKDGGEILAAALAEQEYNDTEGYSNDLGVILPAAKTVTGTLAAGEVDSFAFTMPADGVLTVTNAGTGAQPQAQVNSADGDECWGMTWQLALPMTLELPQGQYHFQAYLPPSATSTAAYTLNFSMKIQAVPTLALGKTAASTIGVNMKAYRIVLPSDGRLKVVLNSGSADSWAWLVNSNWRYVYDCDDVDPTGTLKEGGLNCHLLKGTYYLYLYCRTTAATKITPTHTPATVQTISGTATKGKFATGPADLDLFKFVLSKPQYITITIAGDNTNNNPVTDSYLMVFDKNMGQVLECDDADSNNTNSIVRATLPAGTYYASPQAYWEAANVDYTITFGAGTAATIAGRAGSNAGSITVPISSATYTFSLGTPSRIEFKIVENTLSDAEVFVIDAKTGLSMGWDDNSTHRGNCEFGRQLPAGDYYVVAKDYYGGTGTFDAQIVPPLQQWGAGNIVMNRGHEGNPLFLIVGVKKTAGTNPLPWLISGLLFVDLNAGHIILPLVMPKGGILDYKKGFKPGAGPKVQTVEFANSTQGVFSNLLE